MSTLPARPDAAAIQDLSAKIIGRVILPKDIIYDETRKVYNGDDR